MRLLGSFALALALAGAGRPALAQAAVPPTVPETTHVTGPAGTSAAVTSAEVRGQTPTTVGHVAAQGHAASEAQTVDIITPHITDSRSIDYPCFKTGLVCEAELPRWAPIHIGGVAVDLSPTKHVVMMLIAAVLCCALLIPAGQARSRQVRGERRGGGFASAVEAIVLYLRNEVAVPNLGPHGERFAPFILTLFFFILFANLLGLIPYGSTATGNISVTATLAIITFIVVELAGIRAQGVGYLSTIFYWNKDLPIYMRVPMFLLMSPIEFLGKLTKPFALTIRLFANMTAGHIVVLALIGLVFVFKSLAIGVGPAIMATAIMVLELFVAFLQAFIFALLSAVFIGQIRTAHH
ncbi:ATP synthase subunit a 2 [Gemmatimonadetes bacterium T265]|nr:ATP synthase subunit a 2 [Gemmatimonadetes bacterium T265]